MNSLQIIGIIAAIILLNSSLYAVYPLPGIVNLIAIAIATFFLAKGAAKGGALGKISLVFAILLGLFALSGILGYFGISIPFIGYVFRIYRLSLIVGGLLLVVNQFRS